MRVVDDIRKRGFRGWYERQLMQSFGYLVTSFLALIVVGAGMEWMAQDNPWTTWVLAISVAAAAALVCFVGWRRFHVLLARAELFAENATCAQCGAWGKFAVISSETETEDVPVEAGRPHWIRVKCKKCGNDWRLG